MKGLIRKDLLYLRQLGKVLGILFVFFVVQFFMAGKDAGGLYAMVIVMLSSILAINLFSYDEQAKWDGYAASLPLSRDTIVLARYVLVFLMAGSLSVLLLLAAVVSGHGLSVETAAEIGAGFGAALLICGILMPLFYRFGTQMARLVTILIILIPSLVVSLWVQAKLPVPSVSEATMEKLILSFPVFVVLLYVASYFISSSVFRKKEI